MMDIKCSARDVIDRYLGIPYKHMGRDPCFGIDCWGLVKDTYRFFLNENVIDIEDYGQRWYLKGEDYFLRNYGLQFTLIHSRPALLDVVLFNCSRGTANHAGVVLDARRFIHSSKPGVTVSKFSQRFWKERLVGIYRLTSLCHSKG